MEQNLDRERGVRKKYIEFFAEKLYTRFSYLFNESLGEIKEKAVNRYLDTNMSYDDITTDMAKIIEERKEEYERRLREKAENKAEEESKSEGMPVTAVTVEESKSDGMPVTAVTEEEPIEHYDIPVTAVGTQPELDIPDTKAFGTQPIRDNVPVTAYNQYSISENGKTVQAIDSYTAGKTTEALGSLTTSMNKPSPNGSIASSELNAMMEDKPKENGVGTNNNLEKPKQMVKTDNGSMGNNNSAGNASKGFVSLFNIVLAILSITAFILVAMILNLLLK